jgi:enterochelin esterase-like enzyme
MLPPDRVTGHDPRFLPGDKHRLTKALRGSICWPLPSLKIQPMTRAGLLLVAVAVAGAAPASASGVPASPAQALLPSFVEIVRGPAGGTIWQGVIRNSAYPRSPRLSLVYFPPGFSAQGRYPTLYVLHGIRGSPYSIANGLRFASFADNAIVAGQVRPFLAVMPPAGLTARFSGEWTGVWERYVVDDVVPWSDRNLPALRLRAARAIAGLSAGGYGAADIGLRHPALFGTIESWSGSFFAPHDGSLRHASAKQLAANDPTSLAEGEAALLRRLRTRFFLSCGSRDPGNLLGSIHFARLLAALGVRHRTFFAPGGHDGRFWQAQLPVALHYAFP